jgi:DNA-directed RNA polymerase subunit omega
MARVTIEDCIEKVPSRFTLIHLASQRAKQLIRGARPFVESSNKPIVLALREVAAGYVTLAEDKKEGDEHGEAMEGASEGV